MGNIQSKAKPLTEGIAYTQLPLTFLTKGHISLLTLVPDGLAFAELNGKLRSEVPSQQESLFIPWSWIFLWPHDLVESLAEVLVPAQSFGCLLQLLNVFSFCVWEDEGLGLLHWNKSSTEMSACSARGTNPSFNRAHKLCNHRDWEPGKVWANHCINSFTLLLLEEENAEVHGNTFFFFTGALLYFFTGLGFCVEPDLTLKAAPLSTGLD